MIRTMVRRMTFGRWPDVRAGERLTCPEVGRLLQRFLDDELASEHEIDALVRHLDDCKRCGLEAETYRKIKDSLEQRRVDVAPEAVARLREFGERLAETD
jgi:hypothetical protein